MEWNTLLSTWKLAEEEPEPDCFSRYPINEFEKDFNKIVSSAAFRRLQDKTQVFPLDRSDFVRTRLTHSIEASTIARQLGIMVTQNTRFPQEDIGPEEKLAIPSILLCAGLLHDLGNPPFGHFGETTIGDWFQENLGKITYKGQPLRALLTPQMAADLENFEGNAQALRILLKSRFSSEIDLSAAVIGTLVKYPNDSLSFRREAEDIKLHKLGFYTAEEETFRELSRTLGTAGPEGELFRHPLTYLLEAADDISYATADLEDSFQKGLFTLDQLLEFLDGSYDHAAAAQPKTPDSYTRELKRDLARRRSETEDPRALREWLAHLRRWLMYVASYRFSVSYQDIMAGRYRQDLFWETNHSLTLAVLKRAMPEFAFNTPAILKLELSAQSILSFLLDRFIRAALYFTCGDPEGGFTSSKADKKYMALLPESYVQDYRSARTGDEVWDLYLRLLMVTDYISGMTDSYARTLYHELGGIE